MIDSDTLILTLPEGTTETVFELAGDPSQSFWTMNLEMTLDTDETELSVMPASDE